MHKEHMARLKHLKAPPEMPLNPESHSRPLAIPQGMAIPGPAATSTSDSHDIPADLENFKEGSSLNENAVGG